MLSQTCDPSAHVWFTVVKQRLTTPEAIAKLARAFQVPSKTFSFCGMKDRWGITTQRISFPSSILVREPQVSLFDSMALGNAFPEAHKARLGGHGGNEFTVVLRRVTTDKSPAALDTCIDALKTGFPNYFGLQRFGTGVVPSSEMGVALLQKNFKHVVELLLGSRARRGTTFQAYCEASRGNFREALALTPTSCLLETSVPPPNSQSAFETRCVAPLAVISCTGSIHLNRANCRSTRLKSIICLCALILSVSVACYSVLDVFRDIRSSSTYLNILAITRAPSSAYHVTCVSCGAAPWHLRSGTR